MARSKLEERLDEILHQLYPNDRIVEDWPVKIKGRTLYVDRVLLGRKLAFEIDGRQHDEYVQFMHGDAAGFASHKERDCLKESWLSANGFSLVRLKSNDKLTSEFVRSKVLEAMK